MLLFRNAKTREIVVGAENKVEQVHYAAVVTRSEEELDNELTGGWKVIDVRFSLSLFPPNVYFLAVTSKWLLTKYLHHPMTDGSPLRTSIPLSYFLPYHPNPSNAYPKVPSTFNSTDLPIS